MYLIYINIQRIGGTWPVLLDPPCLNDCHVVKGDKTFVWSTADEIPG